MSNVFDFHGIELSAEGNQLVGDCPFPECEKTQHFYVDESTQQWECKVCDKSGNKFVFLREFHKACLENTTEDQYAELAKQRGIDTRTLMHFEVARNPFMDTWLVPTKNHKGRIVNLHAYRAETGEMYSTPTCELSLFNIQTVGSTHEKPLYICEGHWDAMALHEAFRKTRSRSQFDVIAVPGSACFKESFTKIVANRHVTFLYDDDKGGRDGIKRVVKVIGKSMQSPQTFQILDWGKADLSDEQRDTGYDLRDLKQDCAKASDMLKAIHNYTVPIDEYCERYAIDTSKIGVKTESLAQTAQLKPIRCDKFSTLIKEFREHLYLTQSMQDTLAVMLAVNLSIHSKGNPLWVYVIGPPSSGKTTLGECVFAAPSYAKSVSKITGIVSGFKDDTKEDASLLNLVQDKTLFVKDFTTTLTMPPQTRDNLFGELRDAFDGRVSVNYRNKIDRQYNNVNFTMVACVTDEIRGFNTSALGERFLQIELLGEDHSEDEHLAMSLENAVESLQHSFSEESTGQASPKYYRLQQLTYGFLKNKHDIMLDDAERAKQMPAISKEAVNKIKSLAALVGKIRAKVKREAFNDLAYRPRSELGLRLSSQLLKLGAFLAFVMDKDSIDDTVFSIVRKVALDTAYGFQWEIVNGLSKHKNGLTSGQLATKIHLSESTIKRRLADMQILNLVVRREETNNSGFRGRYAHVWQLSDEIKQLFDAISIRLPKTKPKTRKRKTTSTRTRRTRSTSKG